MRRPVKILIAVGVVVVVLLGAAFAGWYFLVRSEAQPRAKIKETNVHEVGALDGEYLLQPGDAQSFVGYRVQEQFAVAALESSATGRTSDVSGSFSISGKTASKVAVEANLTTLKSDRDRRDERIKTLGLESNRFPRSTFALTRPIDFKRLPKAGETVTTTAVGDFALHGVTRSARIAVEARWDGRDVQVVGHLPILFSDYKMDPPNVAGFVSVRDHGEMEFQLFFRKT